MTQPVRIQRKRTITKKETMMSETQTIKERPILFSGPMVRAILEGKKTQTRRVIKQVPYFLHLDRPIMDWALSGVFQDEARRFWLEVQTAVDDSRLEELICPYGHPGDRLWVRETFCLFDPHPDGDLPVIGQDRMSKGRVAPYVGVVNNRQIKWTACYRADGELEHPKYGSASWKPSIHMPRWASRLLLEVVSVRVERLQEITDEDVEAEGIWHLPDCYYFGDDGSVFEHVYDHNGFSVGGELRCDCGGNSFRELFESTWNKINAKRGFPWASNPWVWVVEFKRISTPDGLT